MICIPAGGVTVGAFGQTGACYSVSLTEGNSPLRDFKLDGSNVLSGHKMLLRFREAINSIRGIEGWCHDDNFLVWLKFLCLGSDWD